jgi:hypothetical protein
MAIDQFPAGERPFRDSKFRNRLNEIVAAVNEMLGRTDDKPLVYEFDGEGGTPGFFPVLLDEVGGSAGDATTACSFTYALLTLAGDSLDTGPFTPHWRPQTPGTLISGDGKIGMAYYDADGELALYSASETIDALVCTP